MEADKFELPLSLSLSDLETLIEAVECWEQATRSEEMDEIMAGVMSVRPGDDPGATREQLEQQIRKQIEANRKAAIEKLRANRDNKSRRGVELRFKLYKMFDSAAVAQAWDQAIQEPDEPTPLDEQPLGEPQGDKLSPHSNNGG